YKVGNNIMQEMIPEEQPVIEYIFDKNGEEVRSQKYLPESEGYTYKNSRILNEDKTVAKITDYAVSTEDGEDVTQETFEGARWLLVVYDVKKASGNNMEAVRTLLTGL